MLVLVRGELLPKESVIIHIALFFLMKLKKHIRMFWSFFQILDLGIIEDSEGKMVSFRDCLIIMTSNLASEKITSLWNEDEFNKEKIKEVILPFFNEHFGAAFMGRTNLVPFSPYIPKHLKICTRSSKLIIFVNVLSGHQIRCIK